MKKGFPLLIAFAFFYTVSWAQSPQSVPYQAVVRNASGNLVVNQLVAFRFTIRDGSTGGTIVYQETQSGPAVITNNLGLVTVQVGGGTPVGSFTFSAINWGSNTKFMDVELDPAGGASYTDMGTSQMMSVPYALYAANSGAAASVPGTTPSGGIIMYTGAWNFDGTGLGTGSLAGWTLCNGNNGAPDLSEQFIMGAANSSELSTTGGTTTHTHTIPAISVPALSIPAEAVTGTIPALGVPSLAITGTVPALTIPSLDISGTIPAIGVSGSIPALSVPALSIPGLSVPSLSISGTIPALNVALGNQPVYFNGSATIVGTSMEGISGAIGYSTSAGNVLELSTGAGANTGHTIANAATNGAVQSYTWTALQLQNPTVTSTAYTLATGHITTGTGTTGTGTTGTGTTGTGTLGSGTTSAYTLATGHIATSTGQTTTATTLGSGNISTVAAATTAYTLGSGSLATGVTSTGTGTTAATTTGSASSLPPYFKLAFIMKQ